MRPARRSIRSFLLVAVRCSLFLLAVALAGVSGQAQPSPLAVTSAFHGIGDLPGGLTFSTVRDAVKHNGVIYAVGASNTRAQDCTTLCSPDTAVLWTFDGTSAQLTAIPNLVTNTGTVVSQTVAAAITPDAQFIAD